MDAETVVIGAGLAGLRCTIRLAEAGRRVVLVDAADAVGGRQRTDEVDGFVLDRGFHVLNPAYPAVRRWVDVADVDLQPFPVGVRVRRANRTVRLGHPLRSPASIPASLASGLLGPRDLLALARWVGPAILLPKRVLAASDRPLGEAWDALGLRGPLRREVFEPFLAGVLADDSGTTSDAFARLLVRMFALGRPGVPRKGIQALPTRLAAAARAAGASVRLGDRVVGVSEEAGGVRVDFAEGDALRADNTVVAVGPEAVADLVDVPAPVTQGLRTWWFAADDAPESALLTVDGRRAGPIVNSLAMSLSAPSYAPTGRHLVQATTLLPSGSATDGSAPDERTVRGQLVDLWGAVADTWQVIRRDDIPHALPHQAAPLQTTSPARITERVFVAGDHRDTASIQGALVSGDRVARAVLATR